MSAEGKTLSDEIEDMLGEAPASEEDGAEEIPDEEVEEQVEGVEDVIADVVEEEEDGRGEEEEAEEGAEVIEDGDEEVVDAEGESEAEEEEEVPDEIAELRANMNKIAEAALRGGVALPDDVLGVIDEAVDGEGVVETPAAPAAAAPVAEAPAVPKGDDFDILTQDMDFHEFLDKPEAFEAGMRGILQRHEQILSQRFMAAIPGIVSNQVRQNVALQGAVEEFYRENNDLKPVRQTVGAVANQLTSKYPDWALGKIMEESAAVTRRILKMPSKKVKGKKGGPGKVVRPSFAKGKGGSDRNKPKPSKSKLQNDIDDLLDI